jgi:hypothetical protein
MQERGIIASAIMHASIIFAATFAWPHAMTPSEDSPPVVPVDLVTVADVTNISATVEEQKPAPPPEQPPQPQIEAPPPPPPPQAEVAPIEPEKKPPPPPKKVEAQVKPPSNPVIPRPKPQKEAPPPKFDVNDVLAMLDKRDGPKPAPPANAKVAETTQKGFGDQTAMTVDIRDALLAQMRECWNVPVGAPNPEQLIVQVRVFLAPDGSLALPPRPEPATAAAADSNPYIKAAKDAALRAISVCEPYKNLPPERYTTWREIVMTFDPSKMVGR